ncbi:MAG: hypothetical protein IKS52_05005 [Clostridia bacterium]|nr:hypothetical protein [Clostridia bacterium]MBO4886663.1 hypothetical protein [Clostridia bacterium]MBR4442611.1 hypothetical protein [Clostridia bacterium]
MTMYNREVVDRALPMVREAVYQLECAQDKLNSARGWGVWDILGGGLIATLVKHGKTDDANDCIRHAGRLMERVQKMMPDIHVGEAPVDEGGFGRVADVLFDGLFTDLYMQGRINDQREAVDRMLQRVRRVERELMRIAN